MNKNGAIKGFKRTKPRGYEVFDRLPRAYKELIWNAPFGTIQFISHTGLASLDKCRETIEKGLRKSCLETYGPDHPQAEKKITEISLEDLGL